MLDSFQGVRLAKCKNMKNQDWRYPDKPYDLRERLLLFACVIVQVVQYLHTCGPIGVALSYQILKCGTSAGANYEEADDGSSDKDTAAKRRIVLRELKETRFRLLVLRRTGFLQVQHDVIIQETTELIRIVATLLRRR